MSNQDWADVLCYLCDSQYALSVVIYPIYWALLVGSRILSS